MAKAQIPARPLTVAELRKTIEDALAKGQKPQDLVLQLTLRDAALFKRSRLFEESEIRFIDGVMHVLGVPTAIGKIGDSSLETATVEAAG